MTMGGYLTMGWYLILNCHLTMGWYLTMGWHLNMGGYLYTSWFGFLYHTLFSHPWSKYWRIEFIFTDAWSLIMIYEITIFLAHRNINLASNMDPYYNQLSEYIIMGPFFYLFCAKYHTIYWWVHTRVNPPNTQTKVFTSEKTKLRKNCHLRV